MNSRAINLKLSLIRSWPFRNKLRLAKWLIKEKHLSGEVVSFLNPGLLLYAKLNSYIEYIVFCTGDYEPEIDWLLKTYLTEGDIALDIGANIGIQSLRMSNYVGHKGRVYSFEPIPYVANRLQRNISLNQSKNIVVNQVALSDYKGDVSIQYQEDWYNQGITSLHFTEGGSLKVQVEIGDDILSQFAITHLKLIKIDVEGFEWSVIKGLQKNITQFRPVVIFEFMLKGTNTYLNINPDEIFQFFLNLGYHLYAVETYFLKPINSNLEFPDTGNVIAIPQ